MASILITGSNRGLGLEWARQYAAEGWRVFATCRHPLGALELQRLGGEHPRLSVHRLDVTSSEDIRALVWELEGEPIDILLNNAGVYLEHNGPRLGSLRYDDWLRTFAVNTLGAVRLTEALTANVERSDQRLVVAISSHMGSIADIGASGSAYYRSSKAALNAAMVGLSFELETRGVGVLILHPGGVMTRMGPRIGLTPEQSVRGMRKIIEHYAPAMAGRFFQYDGRELPW